MGNPFKIRSSPERQLKTEIQVAPIIRPWEEPSDRVHTGKLQGMLRLKSILTNESIIEKAFLPLRQIPIPPLASPLKGKE